MHSTVLAGLVALAAAPLMADAASCAAAYGQCGGSGWSGPTCCVSGYVCTPTSSAYSMCSFGTSAPTPSTPTTNTPTPSKTKTKKPTPTKTKKPSPTNTKKPTPSSSSGSAGNESSSSGSKSKSGAYVTYVDVKVPEHKQVYPAAEKSQCGVLTLVDNVCCPSYCASNNMSDSCKDCTGSCVTPKSADCASGLWGETMTVGDKEKWHYSRSTHYGITTAGACGFGYYGLCTKGSKTSSWTDSWLGTTCDAFCKAYPVLCQDPKDITLRGNFAAPDGKYYSQFWPHLEGTRDNYLSCGECFELIRTKKDGTDYKVGEKGYTDPIVLEVTDSCPCTANSKWCCGTGDDHCGEVSDFKYGCPIPEGSTHLDLSDIAMGRLQGNGTIQDGVIPTRYKRVPCPKPGNIYIWMQQAGPYYFAIGIVNTAGVGGIAKVEIKGAGMTKWMEMKHNPDYPSGHPQERYGSWTVIRDTGPYNVPIGMRITSPNGEQVVNENVITTFTIPDTAPPGAWYIDFGAQFTMYGKH